MVEPSAAVRGESFVDRLAYERVRERVRAHDRGYLPEEPGAHGVVQRLEDALLVEVGHRVEHVETELAADHRGRGEHPVRGLGESGEALGDDPAHSTGNAEPVELRPGDPLAILLVDVAVLCEVAQRLADEERVSFRSISKCLRERQRSGIRSLARAGIEQCRDVGVVEPGEANVANHMLAIERDEHVGERCERRRRFVAVRREQEDAARDPRGGSSGEPAAASPCRPSADRRARAGPAPRHSARSGAARPLRTCGIASDSASLQLDPARPGTRSLSSGTRRAELGRAPAQPVLDRVGGQRVQVGAQCLRDRLVRPQCLFVAAPEQHRARRARGRWRRTGPRAASCRSRPHRRPTPGARRAGRWCPTAVRDRRAPRAGRRTHPLRGSRATRATAPAGRLGRSRGRPDPDCSGGKSPGSSGWQSWYTRSERTSPRSSCTPMSRSVTSRDSWSRTICAVASDITIWPPCARPRSRAHRCTAEPL